MARLTVTRHTPFESGPHTARKAEGLRSTSLSARIQSVRRTVAQPSEPHTDTREPRQSLPRARRRAGPAAAVPLGARNHDATPLMASVAAGGFAAGCASTDAARLPFVGEDGVPTPAVSALLRADP